MTLLPFLLIGVFLLSARLGFVDYPTAMDRNFVHPMDYRILSRALGPPLPSSFQIQQASVPSHDFPSPDGPRPACYLIKLNAADLAMLKEAENWTPIERDSWFLYRNSSALDRFDPLRSNALRMDVYEEKNVSWEAYEISNPVKKYSGASVLINCETSPTLCVYLSTRDNFLIESR